MSSRALFLWCIYALFAGFVLYLNWDATLFDFGGQHGLIKLGLWTALIAFLAYSIYCTSREDLFRSIGNILTLHWGRQIGTDLYLGLLLGLLIIYLNEGGLAALIWLIPIVAYANLAVILYFVVHFDSIALKFLS